MATTAAVGVPLHNWPFTVMKVKLTTIEPGETVDVSHGGPTGCNVAWLQHEVVVEATSGDPVVSVEHIVASDSLSSDTARVRVKTVSGGDLTGCVVNLLFFFVEQASGGIG
jgi:hypothetical protein